MSWTSTPDISSQHSSLKDLEQIATTMKKSLVKKTKTVAKKSKEEVEVSSYRNFDIEHEIISYCDFVPISHLMHMLSSMRETRFVFLADYKTVQIFRTLLPNVAFNQYTRFPASYHVNVTHGIIADKLACLYKNLDVLEYIAFNKGSQSQFPYLQEETVNNTKASFFEVIADLINILMNKNKFPDNGIFNRETFEATYNLQWR